MNLTNYYWYFQSAVPHRICDDIARYGKSIQDQMAVTGGYGNKKLNQKQVKDLKKKRDSNIVWMNDRWIYKEIQPYIHQANASAGWNFQWDFSESCQFTKYVGSKKQHYDWHTDSGPRKNENGKIRKLSMTVALVDGSEYEGGDFEVNLNDPQKEAIHVIKPARLKGSVTIFPSFVWHRVTPVTSGTRYSLVNWHQGWPHT